MSTVWKQAYKHWLGDTAVDTVVRKTYARFFKNDVLRVLYYRQMNEIFRKVLSPNSNCIDIGCHEGNVLQEIVSVAPQGHHLAFEPIPDRCDKLRARFPDVEVLGIALNEKEGVANFHYVKDCDALSGLKRRDYPGQQMRVEEIPVRTAPLDALIPVERVTRLIKIDVEGAELQVLRGAYELLLRWRPFIIFQHGRGSAEFYETTPEAIFDFFEKVRMQISLMEAWLEGDDPLNRAQFVRQFHRRLNYIFLAHPPKPEWGRPL